MIRVNKQGGEHPDTSSPMEQIRRLDEERARLIEGAKTDALAKAEAALAELRDLGFNYRLIEQAYDGENTRQTQAARPSTKGTRQRSDKPCPICDFKTDPPHDARAHRSQSPKEPFTTEELQARGLSRVAS